LCWRLGVQVKAKFGVGIGIIVVTLCGLAWMGAQQSKTYYHTVAELSSLDSNTMHQRIRVGGDVAAGTIKHMPGRVDFVITAEGHNLPVSYVGTDPLPDTFKDGAQALVEGKAMPDGRFVAEAVQAKCASKYEVAPGEGTITTPQTALPAQSGTNASGRS